MDTITLRPLPTFDGIITRLLEDSERPYVTGEPTVPLVLEARERRDVGFLARVLAANSSSIKTAIYEYGAILLRGFDIRSNDDFSSVILGIHGLRAMVDFFMPDAGRHRVKGSETVFQTTDRYRTGGRFNHLGSGFHSESYYSTDVPTFQSLWCKQSCRIGGETALIHMARAYAELDADVRSKLEGDHVCAPRAWLLSEVAERYRVSELFLEQFFSKIGLPITALGDRNYLVLQKPSVYRHPHTRQVSLQVHLGYELPGVQPVLERLLAPHYRGWEWGLHRLGWKSPGFRQLLMTLEALLVRPRSTIRGFLDQAHGRRRPPSPEEERIRLEKDALSSPRLRQKLPEGVVQPWAEAVKRHCSLFAWQDGDIIIIDNMQMMHGEMPGLGLRELRVIMCNPIPIRFPVGAGPTDIVHDDSYESVDTQLKKALLAQPPNTFAKVG